MAQLVKKDTYLYEDAGYGNMVRRQVFAGHYVPDHFVEGDDTEAGALQEIDAPRGPGLGAGELNYPHNRGVSVKEQLERRNAEDTSDSAVEAAAKGGAAAQAHAAQQGEKRSPARSRTRLAE